METLVCVVWSVALLANTLSLKAESFAASTPGSLNDAIDLFATSKISDPKEPIRMDLARLPPAPQHISSTLAQSISQGASATSRPTHPTQTPVQTTSNANAKIGEPDADVTIGTDVILASESITNPKVSGNVTQGSLDITTSLIPLRSTTPITPGSSISSFTNFSEEHPNSSQSTTPRTVATVSLIPPSVPASTLKDLITGAASLGKENQDGLSELDVGDEESDKVPSPSPLDPLLAALISIFIVSTALLSIILFLKFRQQTSHPEFHRLQDLPMDDLLEDTPLSRYSY